MFAGILTAVGGIKNVLIGLLGVALLIGAWRIEQDIESIGALKATNAQLLATNKANLTALAKIQSDYTAAQAALSDALHAQVQMAARRSTINSGITHASAKDDGPVAPVLRRAVDGLFGNDPGAANQDH